MTNYVYHCILNIVHVADKKGIGSTEWWNSGNVLVDQTWHTGKSADGICIRRCCWILAEKYTYKLWYEYSFDKTIVSAWIKNSFQRSTLSTDDQAKIQVHKYYNLKSAVTLLESRWYFGNVLLNGTYFAFWRYKFIFLKE